MIKKVEGVVLEVLQENEEARSNDFLLVYYTYCKYNEAIQYLKFSRVAKNHKELGLPSFATIVRCRRKIFENNPELKPEKITKIRKQKEQEFKEYALNG